jgi:hypothetical protein
MTEYNFSEEPSHCPKCAESFSEILESTWEDGDKYQTYRYNCTTCGLIFFEYRKHGEFMSWRPKRRDEY